MIKKAAALFMQTFKSNCILSLISKVTEPTRVKIKTGFLIIFK